ncbi:alpha/beta-hydrolase [Rhizoclosmatium globosum]|uniref:Alpha/beta-hydrolase n=1 Tax=Rhizoclosmatium globosum TaxID=329046 RepID=A0A1Y2C686_9FUNG|nr:alpha/beta-hydrolase [Rhizoclosmatium globosum]|eukprot:ORY42551.1 alpha/beta-hydrolase [Rhizoclosmatium globosum]
MNIVLRFILYYISSVVALIMTVFVWPLVFLYPIIIALLTVKGPQRAFLFLNHVNFPFGANFNKPESFGFSPHRCRNFYLTTPDDVKLGCWHILPSLFYRQVTAHQEKSGKVPHGSLVTEGVQRRALLERPVFLYFHGNASHRAGNVRIAQYRNLAERLNANVIAFDYRGFGDSEGSPSEEEIAIDARTVYDWIVSQGVAHDQIILLGHSLGSGIATRLARDLGKDKIYPRGLVLQAAYMSIPDAALEYNAFQVLPLLYPVTLFPQLEEYMKSTLHDRFRSRDHIPHLNIPVLIIHGQCDREIPIKNSQQLFAIGVASHKAMAKSAPEVGKVGVQVYREFVADKEEFGTGFEVEGKRWVSVRGSGVKGGEGTFAGPSKIMLVELVHAHHNSVQNHDLAYDSIETFLDISYMTSCTPVSESLSNLTE